MIPRASSLLLTGLVLCCTTASLASQTVFTLTGRVVDGRGKALEGVVASGISGSEALASMTTSNWRPSPFAGTRDTTDAAGRFVVTVTQELNAIESPFVALRAAGWATKVVGSGTMFVDVDLGDVPLKRGATLRGRVVDEAGAPIWRARCGVGRNAPSRAIADNVASALCEALSAEDGSFVIEGVPHAELWFALKHWDYMPTWRTIDESFAAEVDLGDVVMLRGDVIRGTVRDDAGKPVVGVTVDIDRSRRDRVIYDRRRIWREVERIDWLYTGSDGSFESERLQGEPHTVAFKSDRHGHVLLVDVMPGGEPEDVVLTRFGSALLTVRDGAGTLLDDLRVDRVGGLWHTIITSDDEFTRYPDDAESGWALKRLVGLFSPTSGRYLVEGVGPDGLEVLIRGGGVADKTVHIPGVAGLGRIDLDVDMSAQRRVAGIVRDRYGEIVSGATVMLTQPAHDGRPLEQIATVTDRSGAFCFDDPRPGTWSLTASSSRGRSLPIAIEVSDERSTPIYELAIVRVGVMRGQVVTAAEEPLAGASVWIVSDEPDGPLVAQLTTDAQGAFFVDGLDVGRYRVFVSRTIDRASAGAGATIVVLGFGPAQIVVVLDS